MSIYSIYKATNKITRKSYIGFDSNWPRRKNTHRHKYQKNNNYSSDIIGSSIEPIICPVG